MRALRLHEFGAPEVLRVDDIPVPEPGPDDVLVRVAAASLNPVDYKMRRGGYPRAKAEQLPLTLGRDLAGRVEQSGIPDFKPGDEVYGSLEWDQGAQAEYALVNRRGLARKPAKVLFVKAAAVPLAALTAWQGLFHPWRPARRPERADPGRLRRCGRVRGATGEGAWGNGLFHGLR